MKKLKHLFWTLAIVMMYSVGTAQEHSKKIEIESSESTFSFEINADTSIEDLEFLKKLLEDDFNTSFSFENVKTIDNKIVGLKVRLFNNTQSYSKSIDNGKNPIAPFTITLKETGDQNYQIVMSQETAFQDLQDFINKNRAGFDSFFSHTPNPSYFLKMDEALREEMRDTQQQILELFKKQNADS